MYLYFLYSCCLRRS